jgi:hypothetical protein
MRRMHSLTVAIAVLLTTGLALDAGAGKKKKLKNPPSPMNKQVKFEAYPDTDIAMVTYLTSRREFRVGHVPYVAERFHVAEFVIITDHTRKYLRPDLKAEIKMAPQRSKPELMANKNFQKKWKAQVNAYQRTLDAYKKTKIPKSCKGAFAQFTEALQDEIFLANKISQRMFISQKTRARELLRGDLKERFRSRDKDWFDRLLDDFEENPDLEKFYTRFADIFIDGALKKAGEQAEAVMQKVGLEYATAVKESDKDIIE